MLELTVVGAKNSGKTTVIEGLITYLTDKGCRVATIKHTSHSHRFDTPGKDTHRHREAGSLLTAAISKGEVAIFAEPDLIDIQRLQKILRRPIDIWLIEGDRTADRPKILVTRNVEELSDGPPKNIVATIGPQQVENVPAHFETGDYAGLGFFLMAILSEQKSGTQK